MYTKILFEKSLVKGGVRGLSGWKGLHTSLMASVQALGPQWSEAELPDAVLWPPHAHGTGAHMQRQDKECLKGIFCRFRWFVCLPLQQQQMVVSLFYIESSCSKTYLMDCDFFFGNLRSVLCFFFQRNSKINVYVPPTITQAFPNTRNNLWDINKIVLSLQLGLVRTKILIEI